MNSLALQQIGKLLRHKTNGLLMILPILRIQKLIKRQHPRPAPRIVLLHNTGDPLSQPPVELADLHVVGEVDVADVVDALEGVAGGLVVCDQVGVGLGDVEADVLPDLHVDLLDVEVLQAVVDQVEIPFDACALLQQPADHLHQNFIGVFLYDSSLNLPALHSKGFQFVITRLGTQKLRLFPHHADKLQKHLHQGRTLRQQSHRQPRSDLPHSYIRRAIEQRMDGFPKKRCPAFQIFQIFLIVRVVDLDEVIG